MSSPRRLAGLGLPGIAIAAALILGALVDQAWAQQGGARMSSVNPEVSSAAQSLLLNAEAHVKEGQWPAAVDLFQRVIQQYGDSLAALPAEPDKPAVDGVVRYVSVREYCQRRLAALPADGLKAYRDRVDAEAGRIYREAVAARDSSLMRRVIEDLFSSSWGDDALEALGDLAFQDGRFTEAIRAYEALTRPAQGAGGNDLLRYPDPQVELGRVEAKIALCMAALGNSPTADWLRDFATRYEGVEGTLAGRSGSLPDVLKAALAEDGFPGPGSSDARWPTFAGATTRTKVVTDPIDVGSLQWTTRLEEPRVEPRNANNPAWQMANPAGAAARDVPKFHPIILGDQVVVSDDRRIIAYDLNARPSTPNAPVQPLWEVRDPSAFDAPQARMPNLGAARYTLSFANDRIFARMGAPSVAPRGMGMQGGPSSVIVAVQRSSQGKFLWRKAADEIALTNAERDGAAPAGFSGTPVADDRNVYAVMLQPGPIVLVWVVCLDAETGATRWVRFVCASAPNEGGNPNMMGRFNRFPGMAAFPELGHRLLSLDGTNLYVQTDLGAVAALDAASGHIRWLTTYPRKTRQEFSPSEPRETSPAVVQDGLVYAAPQDSDLVIAFDAASGRMAWKADPQGRVVHLLGVAQGRLIATGNHVWTFGARDGQRQTRWPDSQNFEEGYGRGLLAGREIYWPTKDKIYVLDQATGLPTQKPPIALRELFQQGGGNLVAGDGYLVIAGSDRLVVYCQNSRLIQRYRDLIAQKPDEAEPYLRLAQVAEAVGDLPLALQSLRDAMDRADGSVMVDGEPLPQLARTRLYRLHMRTARTAEREGVANEAIAAFREAIDAATEDRDRVGATIALASALERFGEPNEAVDSLQGLLRDEQLGRHLLEAEGQRTARADLLVRDRLRSLVSKHGSQVYARFETEAEGRLKQAAESNDPQAFREIVRLFPLSKAASQACLMMAMALAERGEPSEAARAYREVESLAADESTRARALLGLARVEKDAGRPDVARVLLGDLKTRFGELKLAETDDAVVAAFVDGWLGSDEWQLASGEGAGPRSSWSRSWAQRYGSDARLVALAGRPPRADSPRFAIVEGMKARLVTPGDGQATHVLELGEEPRAIGYLEDRILVVTQVRIAAFDASTGRRLWAYDPSADPASGEDASKGGAKITTFGRCEWGRDRLVVQRGDSELVAFAADEPVPVWSFVPSPGQIDPSWSLGPTRLLTRVEDPERFAVLDVESGELLLERPIAASESGRWLRPPAWIDPEHAAVVLDLRRAGLLDAREGELLWTDTSTDPLPQAEPPRVLAHGRRLVVVRDHEVRLLDPKDGRAVWTKRLGVSTLNERPESFVLDDESLVWVGPSDDVFGLIAIDLDTGKTSWRIPLRRGPTATWVARRLGDTIAAYPMSADPETTSPGLPLVLVDPSAGRLIQRLQLEPSPVGTAVVAGGGNAWLATSSTLQAFVGRPSAARAVGAP